MKVQQVAFYVTAAFGTDRRRFLWAFALWLLAMLSGNVLLLILTSLTFLLRYRWKVFEAVTGPSFNRYATMAFGTELRRFLWVFAIWLAELISANVPLAFLISLTCLLRYWKYFLDFFKSALKNEWPFNFLSAIVALAIYTLTALSSVAANFLVTTITGFHSEEFPATITVLQMLALFFSTALAFTFASGLAALLTGFSSSIANRTAPVAFMLAIPGVIAALGWLRQDQRFLDIIENIVVTTSFSANGRFETGRYVATDGIREFGVKVCRELPVDTLLAPHSDTGYVTAVKRTTPARMVASKYGLNDDVLATNYIFGYVPQDKCPDINAYSERVVRPLPPDKLPN